jgi:uncharacterized protein (TIGR02466 family)
MNLISIYSVPLWKSEYPDFETNKTVFLDTIRTYVQQNPVSSESSNVRGYHSPDTLHLVSELNPLFEYICQMAFKASSDLNFIECDIAITSAWVNINASRGCMNMEHIHEEIFSGVFYLHVPKESGKLVIKNEAFNNLWKATTLISEKNQFTGKYTKIEPIEGDIFLFPSYLPHSVETNDHDEERISISFNLIALPKGSIKYSSKDE